MLFLLVVMSICLVVLTDARVTHVTYPRSYSNRRVQVGSSVSAEMTLLKCATLCLKRKCVGFNFERNSSSCDVRLAETDILFPSSVSEDVTSDFYGGFQDPLSKYDEFCGPLDRDLTFDCPVVSYAPGSCNGMVICNVRSSTFERRFIVYGNKSSTSLLAPGECCSKGAGERLVQMDNATIQGWFCHVLHSMCGDSKGHAFTFGMYRYTVLGDPWLYLCEGNPKIPDGFYTNWYEPDRGKDRCVQMFSGDPYHFKWVMSTCDFATMNGRKYHCVCERKIE